MSEQPIRISSRNTTFYKRVFPVLWFGTILLIFGTMLFLPLLLPSKPKTPLPPVAAVAPAFLLVFGYFLCRKLIFDLVDYVYDCGDFLLVKNGGKEDQIPLSNIMNVSYAYFMNPPRVTLSLRIESSFGNEISFAAPVRFVPFSKSAIIENLILKIDQQRGGHKQ